MNPSSFAVDVPAAGGPESRGHRTVRPHEAGSSRPDAPVQTGSQASQTASPGFHVLSPDSETSEVDQPFFLEPFFGSLPGVYFPPPFGSTVSSSATPREFVTPPELQVFTAGTLKSQTKLQADPAGSKDNIALGHNTMIALYYIDDIAPSK